MTDTDQPPGEILDAATMSAVCKAVDHLRDLALAQFRELQRENIALSAQLEAARYERDTWRMKATHTGGQP